MRSAVLCVVTVGLAACGGDPSGPVGAFEVDVTRAPFGLRIQHPSGLVLSTAPDAAAVGRGRATYELQLGTFRIEETEEPAWAPGTRLTGARRDDDGIRGTLEAEDGTALGTLIIAPDPAGLRIRVEAADPEANRAALAFACDPASEGGYWGLGAHTWDVDHRGERVPVWVSEQGVGKVETETPADVWFLAGTRHQSYLAVPTLMAPRGGASYGLHATTFYRSVWDLCATDPERLAIEAWEGTVEVVVSPGPSPLDVVAQQTARNGRIRAAPDWTFGVWMDAIGGTEAVRAEAAALRAAGVPASALWTEDWRGAERMGAAYVLEEDWRWDRALYPGLPDLIDELHADGFAFMTYFNTFVVEDFDVYPDARDGDHLVLDRRGDPFAFPSIDFGTSYLADLFLERNRAFVKAELRAALDLGIDGWMADFAEWYPADPRTVSPSDGSDPEEAHHRYPVAWAEVNQEVLAEAGADDAVIFQRSGYSGSQGQLQVVWAGDQRTSFQPDDGLPTVVPIMLGLSIAGFPVVTHDVAGYVSATNPNSDRDLFYRWTALGALSPVMRTHHGRDAFANWRWNTDAATTEHFRRWAAFHTRLFPLWAGLARDAQETGAPILRPLAFLDPGDVALHGVTDAYLVGDDLLVAPVVTASTTQRSLRLPRGDWFSWDGEARFEGGTQVELTVPPTEIGLLARAGAVVPMLEADDVATLRASDRVPSLDDARGARRVRVWLGADGATRDASGGRFVLESAGTPAEIPTVAGGEVLASEAGRLEVRAAAAEGEVVLTAGGATHRLRGEGLAGVEAVIYDVRW